MQVKQAIVRFKIQNEPNEKEMTKTLQVTKSTIWFIFKKKECSGQLCSTKNAQKTTEDN